MMNTAKFACTRDEKREDLTRVGPAGVLHRKRKNGKLARDRHCIKQTVHVRDATVLTSVVSAFCFYGSSMIIPKPICSEDRANFLYDLGFLGLCMYGYTTVSYNQILDHLKF